MQRSGQSWSGAHTLLCRRACCRVLNIELWAHKGNFDTNSHAKNLRPGFVAQGSQTPVTWRSPHAPPRHKFTHIFVVAGPYETHACLCPPTHRTIFQSRPHHRRHSCGQGQGVHLRERDHFPRYLHSCLHNATNKPSRQASPQEENSADSNKTTKSSSGFPGCSPGTMGRFIADAHHTNKVWPAGRAVMA